jgi:hypothetical protein
MLFLIVEKKVAGGAGLIEAFSVHEAVFFFGLIQAKKLIIPPCAGVSRHVYKCFKAAVPTLLPQAMPVLACR